MMKKKLSLAIAAVLLLSALFASCASSGNENITTVPSAATTGETVITKAPETNPLSEFYANYEQDDIPESTNFDGAEFTILCDEGQYPKSFADDYTGDVINTAVFTRREVVEERLKVKINVVKKTGAYAGMADFTANLSAGAGEYDLVLSYNLTPASMAVQGLICDIASTNGVNFSKPWWSSTLTENIAINGKIFFTADNSSWNNIRNMLGIFVNKNIFSTYYKDMKIDDLYAKVKDGSWTMEEMFTLAQGVYDDYDMDQSATAKDLYGLCTANSVWNEAWFYAAGFTTMRPDGQGGLELTLTDQSIVDFLDWFRSKFYSDDPNAGIMYRYDSSQYALFKDSRAMMYLSAISMVEQKLEFPFSVLPLPRYGETQDRYYTHFSNTYDMYSIPAASHDREMSSVVLECLASEAYRRIGPAYFEVYLKFQHADDAGLAEMYDIIRSSIVFDTGYLYGELFVSGDNPIYFVRRCLNNNDGYQNFAAKWTSALNSRYNQLWKKTVEKLNSIVN